MFTVIETPTFVRFASNCWNDEDRTNFITFIAANPDAGDVVQGQEAYGKSMRENIPAHVLRQIKEEIENA